MAQEHYLKKLLDEVTATNSAPTAATDGVSLHNNDEAILMVASTAGSGTMTVTVKLWAYSTAISEWMPLGIGPNNGVINGGNALAESSADAIAHTEPIDGLFAFDRLYAEVTAIGGTATAISCWLRLRPANPRSS